MAAVLLALEAAGSTPVYITVARNLLRRYQVQVSVGQSGYVLTPAEARLAAAALWADPGEPGFAVDAVRLSEAADQADAAFLRGAA